MDFVNSSDGWAVGSGGTGAVIFGTTDGGTNWAVQTVPDGLGSATGGVLLGVSFIDSFNGWAVGAIDDSSVVLHTMDGGTTWIKQAVGP